LQRRVAMPIMRLGILRNGPEPDRGSAGRPQKPGVGGKASAGYGVASGKLRKRDGDKGVLELRREQVPQEAGGVVAANEKFAKAPRRQSQPLVWPHKLEENRRKGHEFVGSGKKKPNDRKIFRATAEGGEARHGPRQRETGDGTEGQTPPGSSINRTSTNRKVWPQRTLERKDGGGNRRECGSKWALPGKQKNTGVRCVGPPRTSPAGGSAPPRADAKPKGADGHL